MRTYTSAQQAFIRFCQQRHYLNPNGSPVPASEFTVLAFAAYLAARQLRPSTISTYLASVRTLHVMSGFSSPLDGSARLRQLLRGVARENSGDRRNRLPITFELLAAMRQFLAPERHHDHCMLWSALTLGFFGFLRCGELVARSRGAPAPLTREDVAVENDRITLRLRHTKTRPTQTVTISIARSGGEVCAVKALEAYLHRRGHGPGPLFVYASGQAMVREQLITNLRSLCRRLGLDSSVYSGHSLRIGAATTAAARGLPDWLLKALGRWESECYQTYIHTPRSTLDSVPSILARSES